MEAEGFACSARAQPLPARPVLDSPHSDIKPEAAREEISTKGHVGREHARTLAAESSATNGIWGLT